MIMCDILEVHSHVFINANFHCEISSFSVHFGHHHGKMQYLKPLVNNKVEDQSAHTPLISTIAVHCLDTIQNNG